MNERFVLHMDRCLTCRACEAACPSNVRFGQLIDSARAMTATSSPDFLRNKSGQQKSWFRRWVEHELIGKPSRIDTLRPLVRFYQRSGLQKRVRKSGVLGKTKLALLEAQLPRIEKPRASSAASPGGKDRASSWQTVYPSIGKSRGNVGLFLGCVARLTDVETLNSAISVLNRLGYTVHLPDAQTCCGALHQHGGDMRAASQLEHQNVGAFQGLDLSVVISTASGCGAQLAEYSFFSALHPASKPLKRTPQAQPPAAESIGVQAPRVMDISAFLAIAEGWDSVELAPLPHKILVHEPCSLRNVLRGSTHSYTLLAHIPGARVTPLAGNDQCCGAAGTYFVDQQEISAALLRDKIAVLKAERAPYLATSNVGCAMHIASALGETDTPVEVIHPVTLIARQMGIKS
jgi:glycolate oxidase iron-sulfur subunit